MIATMSMSMSYVRGACGVSFRRNDYSHRIQAGASFLASTGEAARHAQGQGVDEVIN